MITVVDVEDVRRRCDTARRAGHTVGLVPTMGKFHEGHRALMRAAGTETDLVVVSLFVNPTQFGTGEDLAGYPRDPEGDAAAAAEEGVDVLFTPTVEGMYPDGARTSVHVDGLTARLCGASRPTHFDGVATVVTKLFSIVGPCRAYFGRKDAQQVAVVRRLVADLHLPVTVVGVPLVRDADGLARSSRNTYLDDEQRRAATVLSRALQDAVRALHAGQRDAAALVGAVAATVDAEPGVRLDYAELVDAATVEPATRVDGEQILAVAAHVGPARLIDNLGIVTHGSEVDTDLGVVVEEQLA
ncbi:MAG TPA: pantoate--beta-alanine ligase [Acidimicrobiia bacterium]|nr:pantoate--beta-alanine ligase [Acidimicrobiia bacterium]